MENQICVECGSDDLTSAAPVYPHIMECGNCGHPNDAPTPVDKDKKCEICKRRKATDNAMYNGVIVDCCKSCYDDILDEENE